MDDLETMLAARAGAGKADPLEAMLTARAQGKSPATAVAADPTDDMSGIDKFRSGMGKAFADIGRGVGQMVPTYKDGKWSPLVTADDVAESRRLDAPLMNTGAGVAGNVAGDVAAFTPAAFVPGANSIAGGALIGALMGMTRPAASRSEALGDVQAGAIGGAAVPAALTGAKVAKGLLDPLYQSGRNTIVGRTLADASAQDPAELARLLRQSQSAVPGVQYTVAEAAQNPSLAALQRTASQINPTIMNEATGRQAANNAARVGALSDLSGADGRRAFTEAVRDSTADKMYGAARSAGVDASALTPEAQANIASFQQRLPDDVLSRAKELAKVEGVNMDNESAISGLHWVKKALDSKIETANRAGDNTLVRAYTGLKTDLLTGMDNMSPAYKEARQTFAQMSKPINEMDVVGDIASKSTRPLDGQLMPGAYARALSDKTASRVTGMSGATLENTLSPEANDALGAIRSDLERQNFAATAGRPVGSDTVQKLAYSNLMRQAGIPSMVQHFGPSGVVGNLLERGGQIAYGDANKKLSEQLARALLNPNDAASLLEASMVSPKMKQLANAIRRGGTSLGGGTAPNLLPTNQ